MSFSFYQVDPAYSNFLRQSDPCIPYTSGQKATRPFVGIVLTINGLNYYAPLSSPKPKHINMKNQVDFLKINKGYWGVINFNNMIPVHSSNLQKVQMRILPTDTQDDINYKNLLSNQLSWCNANRQIILTHATKLYELITQGKGHPGLANRCCNFTVDEMQCKIYQQQNKPNNSTP